MSNVDTNSRHPIEPEEEVFLRKTSISSLSKRNKMLSDNDFVRSAFSELPAVQRTSGKLQAERPEVLNIFPWSSDVVVVEQLELLETRLRITHAAAARVTWGQLIIGCSKVNKDWGLVDVTSNVVQLKMLDRFKRQKKNLQLQSFQKNRRVEIRWILTSRQWI